VLICMIEWVWKCLFECMREGTKNTYMCMHTHTHKHTNTHTQSHTHMITHTQQNKYIQKHKCTHVIIDTHTYSPTHLHTHKKTIGRRAKVVNSRRNFIKRTLKKMCLDIN